MVVEMLRRGDLLSPGERRAWHYWDEFTVTNGGTVAEFFTFRDGPAGKTPQQTNLRLPGQIPAGHVFKIHSMAFKPALGTSLAAAVVPLSIANANAILDCSLELEVSNVIKFQTIARKCPAGGGYFGALSISSNAAINVAGAQNGFPSPVMGMRFGVGEDARPVVVTANENFLVRIRYVTAPTVTVNIPIKIRLSGILFRPFQ